MEEPYCRKYWLPIEVPELNGLHVREHLPLLFAAYQWLSARISVEESGTLKGVKLAPAPVMGKFGGLYPIMGAFFDDASQANEIEKFVQQEISRLLDQRSVKDFLYYVDATGARRLPRTMTHADLFLIECSLDIRLPESYRRAVTSVDSLLPFAMFTDPQMIIGTNLGYRRSSWLGRPLAQVFFVFGRDDEGNALYMDLDVPEPVIFSADHKNRCGRVEARSFDEWLDAYEEENINRNTDGKDLPTR